MSLATLGLSYLIACLVVVRAARPSSEARPTALCVVLGKALRHGELDAVFHQRLDRALALCAVDPGTTVMVLGGPAAAGLPSEAAQGAAYLRRRGLAPDRILMEASSRNTLENLRNLRAQLRPAPGFILVTSGYHLARARAMAATLGLEPQYVVAEVDARVHGRVLGDILCEGALLHWYFTGKWLAQACRWQRAWERIS